MPAIEESSLVDDSETQLDEEVASPTRFQKFKRFLRKHPILSTTAGVAVIVLAVLAGQQVFGGRGADAKDGRTKEELEKRKKELVALELVPYLEAMHSIKTHKELDRYIGKLGPNQDTTPETIRKIHTTLRGVLLNFKGNPEKVQAVYEKIVDALCYMHTGAKRIDPRRLIDEEDLKILRETKRDIKQKTTEFLTALKLAHEPWFHTYWNIERVGRFDELIFNAKSGEQYIQGIRKQLGEIEGK